MEQLPLPELLQSQPQPQLATGIFEASIGATLQFLGRGDDAGECWGIVTTGKAWEAELDRAVRELILGKDPIMEEEEISKEQEAAWTFKSSSSLLSRFVGVTSTGLNASELHEAPAEQVRARVIQATGTLARRAKERQMALGAVCLGCAGMVGMEEWVRLGLQQEMPQYRADGVKVIDGVKAGIAFLIGGLMTGL